jgi:hypothetical protein
MGQKGSRVAETDRPFLSTKADVVGLPAQVCRGQFQTPAPGEHGSPDLVTTPGRIIASVH